MILCIRFYDIDQNLGCLIWNFFLSYYLDPQNQNANKAKFGKFWVIENTPF